jgi:transposase, IS5 family
MLIAAGVMPTPSCCTAPARVWCGWRRRHGIALRQSSARVGTIALIQDQRYAHAKPFKRAAKALRRLRTMLGRVIRDVTRKTAPRPELAEVFALPLALARRVRDQRQRERGRKSLPSARSRVYSLHAPEVECILGSSPRPKARPISAMSSA